MLTIDLKESYKELDVRITRRLALVSIEADLKLTLIIADTKREQDRLLAFDKHIQTQQEELYQTYLQLYIVQLNEWRSKELGKLQKQLEAGQQLIFGDSRNKIKQLNIDINRIKNKIINDEQTIIDRNTSDLTAKIFDSSKEAGLQHLGSESKTELNLRIHASVGRIAPGHGCTNDPTV